jgi:hypothetical protein
MHPMESVFPASFTYLDPVYTFLGHSTPGSFCRAASNVSNIACIQSVFKN